MWVDYRGPLSTVYNDGEISTCGEILEAHFISSPSLMAITGAGPRVNTPAAE